jgi:hypothetical protein
MRSTPRFGSSSASPTTRNWSHSTIAFAWRALSPWAFDSRQATHLPQQIIIRRLASNWLREKEGRIFWMVARSLLRTNPANRRKVREVLFTGDKSVLSSRKIGQNQSIHSIRFVSANGITRSTLPLESRMRISPERKRGWIHGCFSAQSFWKRGSFRSGSNIGSNRRSAGVSGTFCVTSGPE